MADWKEWHSFECRGQLSAKEINRIEKTNVFIKLGQLRRAQQTTPGDNDNLHLLAQCKLEDLVFGKKLGEGSHGEVLAAVHTPT